MTDRWKPQFRISHLLWAFVLVAAFYAGRYWERSLIEPVAVANTFDRNAKVAIALTGKFDLDSDGTNDVDELRRLIDRNGGVVTYYEAQDGKTIGVLNAETRFLVVSNTDAARNPNNQIVGEANRTGVTIIDQQKLLTWMGVSGSAKIAGQPKRIGESNGFQQRTPRPHQSETTEMLDFGGSSR